MNEILGHEDIVGIVDGMKKRKEINPLTGVNFEHFSRSVGRFFRPRLSSFQEYNRMGLNDISKIIGLFQDNRPDYKLGRKLKINWVEKRERYGGGKIWVDVVFDNLNCVWGIDHGLNQYNYGIIFDEAFYIADKSRYGTAEYPFERVFIKSKD